MTLKDSKNDTYENDFYNSWLKHKYAIYLYVLQCNAYIRPDRRRQRLILMTKAIIQLVFKKEQKTVALTYNSSIKSPLLSQLS